MPIHVRIDESQDLVEVVLEGEVTKAELREAMDRYFASDYVSLPKGLFDFSALTQSDVTEELVREAGARAAEAVDEVLESGRLAIVVSGDAHLQLASLYQRLRGRSPVEVKAFSERKDARRWLGLPLRESSD